MAEEVTVDNSDSEDFVPPKPPKKVRKHHSLEIKQTAWDYHHNRGWTFGLVYCMQYKSIKTCI